MKWLTCKLRNVRARMQRSAKMRCKATALSTNGQVKGSRNLDHQFAGGEPPCQVAAYGLGKLAALGFHFLPDSEWLVNDIATGASATCTVQQRPFVLDQRMLGAVRWS